jgi:hypothetical protein
MIISTLLLSYAHAGTLQGGAVISAQESLMYGAEVRASLPSSFSFYGRLLQGNATEGELEIFRIVAESGAGEGIDASGVDWQRRRIEFGTLWRAWDATALGNGAFLSLGAEGVIGWFAGRDEHLRDFNITADTDSSTWLQPVIEFGAALNVPFLAGLEIKQSVGYSFPVWSTGFVFTEQNGEYLENINDDYNSDLDRSSFTDPYFETVTTMTGEVGMSWLSIRTRIRSYSASEFVQVLKAANGDEEAQNSIEIMPEFVIGVGF